MKLYIDSETYIDTSEPIDLSIGLSNTINNPRAWYVDPPVFEPVRTENYIGAVVEGGVVNFRNIFFNPHGHGTHTECLGHITPQIHSVNSVFIEYFFKVRVLSVEPKKVTRSSGVIDEIIYPDQLDLEGYTGEALIVRSLPNNATKKEKHYSSVNPPYFDRNCVAHLLKKGVDHLLVDVPSVDREEDGGELAFHHAFWEVPENPNFERTITEMIFVPDEVEDGDYILELQVSPFENDAAPSRPIIYQTKGRTQ